MNKNKDGSITKSCRDGGEAFTIDVKEQEWYEKKGYTLPNTCKEHRAMRKGE